MYPNQQYGGYSYPQPGAGPPAAKQPFPPQQTPVGAPGQQTLGPPQGLGQIPAYPYQPQAMYQQQYPYPVPNQQYLVASPQSAPQPGVMLPRGPPAVQPSPSNIRVAAKKNPLDSLFGPKKDTGAPSANPMATPTNATPKTSLGFLQQQPQQSSVLAQSTPHSQQLPFGQSPQVQQIPAAQAAPAFVVDQTPAAESFGQFQEPQSTATRTSQLGFGQFQDPQAGSSSSEQSFGRFQEPQSGTGSSQQNFGQFQEPQSDTSSSQQSFGQFQQPQSDTGSSQQSFGQFQEPGSQQPSQPPFDVFQSVNGDGQDQSEALQQPTPPQDNSPSEVFAGAQKDPPTETLPFADELGDMISVTEPSKVTDTVSNVSATDSIPATTPTRDINHIDDMISESFQLSFAPITLEQKMLASQAAVAAESPQKVGGNTESRSDWTNNADLTGLFSTPALAPDEPAEETSSFGTFQAADSSAAEVEGAAQGWNAFQEGTPAVAEPSSSASTEAQPQPVVDSKMAGSDPDLSEFELADARRKEAIAKATAKRTILAKAENRMKELATVLAQQTLSNVQQSSSEKLDTQTIDFGAFESAPAERQTQPPTTLFGAFEPAPPVTSSEVQPSMPVAPETQGLDFGEFASAPTEQQLGSAATDFGAFESTPAQQPVTFGAFESSANVKSSSDGIDFDAFKTAPEEQEPANFFGTFESPPAERAETETIKFGPFESIPAGDQSQQIQPAISKPESQGGDFAAFESAPATQTKPETINFGAFESTLTGDQSRHAQPSISKPESKEDDFATFESAPIEKQESMKPFGAFESSAEQAELQSVNFGAFEEGNQPEEATTFNPELKSVDFGAFESAPIEKQQSTNPFGAFEAVQAEQKSIDFAVFGSTTQGTSPSSSSSGGFLIPSSVDDSQTAPAIASDTAVPSPLLAGISMPDDVDAPNLAHHGESNDTVGVSFSTDFKNLKVESTTPPGSSSGLFPDAQESTDVNSFFPTSEDRSQEGGLATVDLAALQGIDADSTSVSSFAAEKEEDKADDWLARPSNVDLDSLFEMSASAFSHDFSESMKGRREEHERQAALEAEKEAQHAQELERQRLHEIAQRRMHELKIKEEQKRIAEEKEKERLAKLAAEPAYITISDAATRSIHVGNRITLPFVTGYSASIAAGSDVELRRENGAVLGTATAVVSSIQLAEGGVTEVARIRSVIDAASSKQTSSSSVDTSSPLSAKLAAAGMMEEASLCQQHEAMVHKVEELEAAYQLAKDSDELEEAMRLRSELKAAQQRIVDKTIVESWQAMVPSLLTQPSTRPATQAVKDNNAFPVRQSANAIVLQSALKQLSDGRAQVEEMHRIGILNEVLRHTQGKVFLDGLREIARVAFWMTSEPVSDWEVIAKLCRAPGAKFLKPPVAPTGILCTVCGTSISSRDQVAGLDSQHQSCMFLSRKVLRTV